MLCLVFLTMGETYAAVLFLASGMIYASAHPLRSISVIGSTLVPWIYPAIALASVFWSDAGVISLRAAVELCLATATMIVLAHRLPVRHFISALMCALFVGAIASVALGTRAAIGMSGTSALTGIFASKNALAYHMAVLILAAASVLVDRGQVAMMRAVSCLGLLAGLALLWAAKSAGALLMTAAAVGIFGIVVFVGAVPTRMRARAFAGVFAVMIASGSFVIAMAPEIQQQIIVATGKDATLTGRTYLWFRADRLIAERPLLGYGYQAFWRQGRVEPEGLWRYAHVAERAGFHFHNLYYECAIELGLIGAAAMTLTEIAIAMAALRWAIARPGADSAFIFALIMLLVMRSFIEVDLGYPFQIATPFPALMWIYCRVARNGRLGWNDMLPEMSSLVRPRATGNVV